MYEESFIATVAAAPVAVSAHHLFGYDALFFACLVFAYAEVRTNTSVYVFARCVWLQ